MKTPRTQPRRKTAPRTHSHRHIGHAWSTADEVDFVNHLGTGLWSAARVAPRDVLLARYLDAAAHRTDWGAMDRFRVLQAVRAMLGE